MAKRTDRVGHTKKALLEALEASLGIVTIACRNVGIARSTFYNYIDNDPEFAAAVKDVEEVVLDFAESQLHKQIKEGNTAATIFYMKTKGKKRGYIESQNLDHTTGGKEIKLPIISFEWPEDDE